MSRIHRWSAPALALAGALGLVLADPAQAARVEAQHLAYVDPGAGSFILQAVVAGIAGAAVAVSAYWRRIKRFLGIDSGRDDGAESEDTTLTDE
jgi:multisubunit Na+/H+ antiporter MnhC subunit